MNATELKDKAVLATNFLQYKGYSIGKIGVNIVEVKFEPGFEAELEDAEAIVKHLGKLCINNKPVLLLALYADDNIFSKEARQFVASKEVNSIVKAEALVLSSMALRIMGNFYLKINKPARESKLFNSRNAAFEWLSKR